ncbi:MAG: polyprenyl synthetase family protein [Nitrospira sp.]
MPQQGPAISTINSMADVWDAYRGELDGVEHQIRKNFDSSVALVNTVAAHILNSGGKRVRPLLLLLSARACGYTGYEHHQLGSLIEFIHTATLLHDDVVDEADIRRGRSTARKVWGNQISILVGDYLYSKAMAQIVEFRSHGMNEVLAEACTKMAEGEVLQLYYNGNPAMPECDYLKIVEHKTAGLIAAACRMGAILAEASEDRQDALFRFGQYLGIAFQVADDTLDYNADGERLGKTLGQDLRQGKATLPLLHLLGQCGERDRSMIKDRMETRTLSQEDLERILALMHEYGSLAYAMDRARTYIAAAKHELDAFEDSTARRALSVAADYMITRDR